MRIAIHDLWHRHRGASPGAQKDADAKRNADESAERRAGTSTGKAAKPWERVLAALVVLGVVGGLVLFGLGWYWSREPALIDPTADLPAASSGAAPAPGVATVTALIDVTRTLLDKPGGYLRNDVAPPGVLLDNMPNWEYGALVQVRAFTTVLRNDISRPQAQSPPDPDLSIAEPRLEVDSRSWMFPSDESAYGQAVARLRHYRARLEGDAQPEAFFVPRSKNLTLWLQVVARRLGGLSERLQLGASGIPLEGDDAAATAAPSATSWWQTDDVFYEARGAAWALLVLSRGVEVDFHDALAKKKALATFHNLEATLAAAERPMHSPFVIARGGFGILASHDLTMAAYLSSATNIVRTLENLMQND